MRTRYLIVVFTLIAATQAAATANPCHIVFAADGAARTVRPGAAPTFSERLLTSRLTIAARLFLESFSDPTLQGLHDFGFGLVPPSTTQPNGEAAMTAAGLNAWADQEKLSPFHARALSGVVFVETNLTIIDRFIEAGLHGELKSLHLSGKIEYMPRYDLDAEGALAPIASDSDITSAFGRHYSPALEDDAFWFRIAVPIPDLVVTAEPKSLADLTAPFSDWRKLVNAKEFTIAGALQKDFHDAQRLLPVPLAIAEAPLTVQPGTQYIRFQCRLADFRQMLRYWQSGRGEKPTAVFWEIP